MLINLDDTFRSELLLLPARKSNGLLQGLEITVNFVGNDSNVRIPTELVVPRLSFSEIFTLFDEQLALLETCQLFFLQHQLTAWINISPAIAEALLSNEALAAKIRKFPFLEFSINENFPDLNKGKDNPSLFLLAKQYAIVLANFGAGTASTKAIFDGLFKRIILDKNFVQQRLASPSFEPFIRVIVSQIEPYCDSLMIAGIDDDQALKRASVFPFSAMQGTLWPPVTVEQLTSLVQP
ncbi:EAL domain-containing protein [Enterobacter sp. Bisph1]|uniref:EAL domain-containing protein n=1 Tax=Enterobacter sp. Bisph1 TaxID=1274399 RepID=UPI00057C2FA5|nr:EAL domain-containing protein [Enterobacter sp. Bisph1]